MHIFVCGTIAVAVPYLLAAGNIQQHVFIICHIIVILK